MSLEPSWNLEYDFPDPDLTAKVHELADKYFRKLKDEQPSQEHIKNSMDFEFRENILKRVRQRLEEEKPRYLAMQDEVQEIQDMLSVFKKRTDHIVEDLKFVKLLTLEAHDRSEINESKMPSSPLQSPGIFGELSSGFQK